MFGTRAIIDFIRLVSKVLDKIMYEIIYFLNYEYYVLYVAQIVILLYTENF